MRKFNSVVAVLVFAVFAVFLAVEGAEAFCVYNNTDTVIYATQTSGGNFSKSISPGEKECCNWKEISCNGVGSPPKRGKRDSTVRFDVDYYTPYSPHYTKENCCKDFPIKAGGWLTVEGSGGNYKCVAHFE